MANPYSLKEFQETLAQRLKEAATDPAPDSRLAVQAGADHWLLRLPEVGEIMPLAAVADRIVTVPLSQPWYVGVANVRGNLIGVTDFAQFLGGAPTVATPAARLVLIAERFQFLGALLVDRLIGLRNRDRYTTAAATATATETAAEAAGAAPRWQGVELRDRDGGLWHELDMAALLADERFLAAGRLN
jgi:twitching motility protein PilI